MDKLLGKIMEQDVFQPAGAEEQQRRDTARGKRFHIVQEETGGIPYDPVLFEDESDADEYYIQLVNENFNEKFTTFEEASKFMEAHFEDYGVRMWMVRANKKGTKPGDAE